MPTAGVQVFEILKRSLAQAQQEAREAHEDAGRIDREMADLVSRRTEAVMELARLVLPELTRQTVDRGFAEVRQDLLVILERKERRAEEIAGRLNRLHDVAEASRQKLKSATEDWKTAVARQQTVEADLATRLAADPEFQQLSRRALEAEAELKRDEERVIEIANEARDKLPVYEQSRLFQYLNERQFGTGAYQGRGLARRLDRWIGRLVQFDKAARSYRFLLTTPALMQAETERRKAEFNGLMQRLEEIERSMAEQAGQAAAQRAVEMTASARQRAEDQLAGDDERARAVEQELAALDQEQGRFYEEALARVKQFLSRAEVNVLEQRSRMTPDQTDDAVTLQIRVLNEEIATMEPRLTRQQALSAAAARASEGLAHLTRRFEQANFDDIRSFFPDSYDIRQSIELYRSGALSRDAFWDQIKKQQERVPTEFEQRASKTIAEAMNGSVGGALASAMFNVAGAALGQSVGRSLSRRRGK